MKDLLFIGTNGHVSAVNPKDGAEVWRTKLGTMMTGRQDVCVLQHEDRIFAGSFGHLYCIDAKTGQIIWHNELSGLGHNEVTLTIGDKSIQYVSSHTHSHS